MLAAGQTVSVTRHMPYGSVPDAMRVLTGGARLEQTGELYTRWRPTHILSTFNNNINEMLRRKKKEEEKSRQET